GAAMVAADITTVGGQRYGVSNAGAVNVRGADVTFKATASDADVVFEGDLLAGATAYDQATLLDYDDKSAGSWSLPFGAKSLKVWAIGAGGGGGGADQYYDSGYWRDYNPGGGGGAGGVVYYTLDDVSGLSALSYAIGAGGRGGYGGANGADGRDTTVTLTVSSEDEVLTAEGGEAGRWTRLSQGFEASGGGHSGGDGGRTGGPGGESWYTGYGGGGGGAIGGNSGEYGGGGRGGYGGESSDVSGLQAALELADPKFADNSSKPKAIGAERADYGNGNSNREGHDAKSFGGGGGGGDDYYDSSHGGDGLYGGGGGGAGTQDTNGRGGTGGDGAVVIRYSLDPQSVTIDAGDDVRVGGDLTGKTVTINTGDGTTGESGGTDGSNVAGAIDVADSGAGLTKQGGGTLKLTADNTFTGDTNIEAGTLQIGDGGATGALGSESIKIGDGATLDIRRSDSYTLSGDISDAAGTTSMGGSVAIDSSGGTITLSGNNSYSGGTTVTAGVLKAGSDLTTDGSGNVTGGAFGFGKTTGGDGLITVAAGAELDLNSYTISNDLNLSGGGVNGGALNHSGS
ncbi:autotransporter-associated beta strand repeat-containing protein, partial [Spiribacter sp. 218]|uniref:autotransporter-associated beta strand repeat-containing protein n=1 Tax=Spiribacter pallidus TaxID=1987936 RepID=UPI00349F5140